MNFLRRILDIVIRPAVAVEIERESVGKAMVNYMLLVATITAATVVVIWIAINVGYEIPSDMYTSAVTTAMTTILLITVVGLIIGGAVVSTLWAALIAGVSIVIKKTIQVEVEFKKLYALAISSLIPVQLAAVLTMVLIINDSEGFENISDRTVLIVASLTSLAYMYFYLNEIKKSREYYSQDANQERRY